MVLLQTGAFVPRRSLRSATSPRVCYCCCAASSLSVPRKKMGTTACVWQRRLSLPFINSTRFRLQKQTFPTRADTWQCVNSGPHPLFPSTLKPELSLDSIRIRIQISGKRKHACPRSHDERQDYRGSYRTRCHIKRCTVLVVVMTTV